MALATALAIIVLPVPGGPYMSTPRGGSIPADTPDEEGGWHHTHRERGEGGKGETLTNLLVELEVG